MSMATDRPAANDAAYPRLWKRVVFWCMCFASALAWMALVILWVIEAGKPYP